MEMKKAPRDNPRGQKYGKRSAKIRIRLHTSSGRHFFSVTIGNKSLDYIRLAYLHPSRQVLDPLDRGRLEAERHRLAGFIALGRAAC